MATWMEEKIKKLSDKLSIHLKNDMITLETVDSTITITIDEAKDIARLVILNYFGT